MMAKSYAAFYDLQLQLHLGTFGREYTSLAHGWLAPSLTTVTAKARSCLVLRTSHRDGVAGGPVLGQFL